MGTRPEIVKLAPVIFAARSSNAETIMIATGQHDEMARQMLRVFEPEPDHSLRVMRRGQSLHRLTARLIDSLADVLERERPDLVVVQGDTTGTFAGALAAFYAGAPVAHVEAGLRTGNLHAPFPEEANRRLVSELATFNFCPTHLAAENLRAEGVAEGSIEVVGNTVVDALHWAREAIRGNEDLTFLPRSPRRVLVTMHRRENQGETMSSLARALAQVGRRSDTTILFPVHLSPEVRKAVVPALQGVPGVILREPLDYLDMVRALLWCDLVVTDSGGVQEEAPTFGRPVLVVREATERPEAVLAGVARVVGTDSTRLVEEVERLLDDERAYAEMARVVSPFGDGHAAERIVARLGLRNGQLVGA
jgi:UDP-N-acetylglucosamine 2-epimerase (non-hydrolysing)